MWVNESFRERFRPNRGVVQYMHQAARKVGGAVSGAGLHRIAFEGCEFRNTENYGAKFDDGCVSNRFVGCTFRDLGAGGLWIGSVKDSPLGRAIKDACATRDLEPKPFVYRGPDVSAFNVVEDCEIAECGRVNPEGCGIVFTHVSDSRIEHCDIHDLYYTGVSLGWVWGYWGSAAQRNTVAFNRIWDIGKGVMSDMAGVYTLGASFGTVISNNVIHAVKTYSYGGWGISGNCGAPSLPMESGVLRFGWRRTADSGADES